MRYNYVGLHECGGCSSAIGVRECGKCGEEKDDCGVCSKPNSPSRNSKFQINSFFFFIQFINKTHCLFVCKTNGIFFVMFFEKIFGYQVLNFGT